MLSPQYIAGLFDGEGSIHIEKNLAKPGSKIWRRGYRNNCYRLVVAIVNRNLRVLRMLKEEFGGTIMIHKSGFSKKSLPAYQWRITDNRALKFLETIKPYVIIKEPQVKLGITFQKHKNSWKEQRTYQLSAEELNARERMRQKMHLLNNTWRGRLK